MKSLEHMICLMQDDLNDSWDIYNKRMYEEKQKNDELCNYYTNRLKQRLEMFDRDVDQVNKILEMCENELFEEIGSENKDKIEKLKNAYMKFYEYTLKSAEMLKDKI